MTLDPPGEPPRRWYALAEVLGAEAGMGNGEAPRFREELALPGREGEVRPSPTTPCMEGETRKCMITKNVL